MKLRSVALVAGALAMTSWGRDTQQQQLTVLVLNQAGVLEATLESAAETSRTIFEKAGIETKWLTCLFTAGKDPCNLAGGIDTPALTILVGSVPVGKDRQPDALGMATLTAPRDRTETMAYIFYDRVEDAACGTSWAPRSHNLPKAMRRALPAVSRLLGNVMAHEAAHLLGLGHSSGGVMSPGLNLEIAAASSLPFKEREARELRDAVAERLAGKTLTAHAWSGAGLEFRQLAGGH